MKEIRAYASNSKDTVHFAFTFCTKSLSRIAGAVLGQELTLLVQRAVNGRLAEGKWRNSSQFGIRSLSLS